MASKTVRHAGLTVSLTISSWMMVVGVFLVMVSPSQMPSGEQDGDQRAVDLQRAFDDQEAVLRQVSGPG
jgi:hypothetical protein